MSRPSWRWVLATVTAALAGVVLVPPAPAAAIVGGAPANWSAYPYYADVHTNGICGGAVISPKWILTAAHCLVGSTSSQVRVALSNGSVPTATSIVKHPEYNGDQTDGHDLGMIEVP